MAMIYYKDFCYNTYNWQYCYYKGERRCSNIFNFDIETSSVFYKNGIAYPFDNKRPHKPTDWYEDAIKVGFCYIWQFGVDDTVVYGRLLDDFLPWLESLVDQTIKAKICCYIHNAAFEFGFLRNFLPNDVKVFARKKRRPIYFSTDNIEFRCSYMLTRLSLAKWAHAKKLPVKKLEGDLDYNIIRTPYTKMQVNELDYCEHDILVMYHGIKQYVDKYGTIWDIPLTQTGEVRLDFNRRLMERMDLHKKMQKLVPDELSLYRLLLLCFWGGIAHANQLYSNTLLNDLDSWDFTSSYPWAMVSELYPQTPFVKCKYDDKFNSKRYSYIIVVRCNKIKSKMWNTYISVSKCNSVHNPVDDNGRLLQADEIIITCTNVDWLNIQDSYKMYDYEILDFYVSINAPLDKDIILYILELFANKTLFDGVSEEYDNYCKSKEFINALFGMMVTRDITDDITYKDGAWDEEELTEKNFKIKTQRKKAKLKKLNNAIQIGVWITAYARNNLWTIVKQLDDYTAYLDTDSDKLTEGYDKSVIIEYNKKVEARQEEIAKSLDISLSMFRPESPSGKKKSLGTFCFEGHYKQFKTLGAKKYIYSDDNGKLHMTVSGVRKAAVNQLNSIDDFKIGFTFDVDYSKKLTLYYNDNQPTITINKGQYDEWVMPYKYGICTQPTTYTLGMTDFYEKTLLDVLTEKSKIFSGYETLSKIIDNAKRRQDVVNKKKKNKKI